MKRKITATDEPNAKKIKLSSNINTFVTPIKSTPIRSTPIKSTPIRSTLMDLNTISFRKKDTSTSTSTKINPIGFTTTDRKFVNPKKPKILDTVSRISDLFQKTVETHQSTIKNTDRFRYEYVDFTRKDLGSSYYFKIPEWEKQFVATIIKNGITIDALNAIFANGDIVNNYDANNIALKRLLLLEKSINNLTNTESKINICYVFKNFPSNKILNVNEISQKLSASSSNNITVVNYTGSRPNGDDILAIYIAIGLKSILYSNDRMNKIEDDELIFNEEILPYSLLCGSEFFLNNSNKHKIMNSLS